MEFRVSKKGQTNGRQNRITAGNTGLKKWRGDGQVESFLISITFVAGDSDELFSRHFFKPRTVVTHTTKILPIIDFILQIVTFKLPLNEWKKSGR
jgi:hypothetical protein